MIKLGIIGDPIEHSLSPALHTWVLTHLGIAGEYRAYRVRPHQLPSFLETARELVGFNVTIPHKERIIPLLDDVDPLARLLGAVNTVVNRAGKLVGYNTDYVGFVRSLEPHLPPRRAVLLGAGGAARAASHALLRTYTVSLTIVNRSRDRARQLLCELQRHYPDRTLSVARDDTVLEALSESDFIVNATPAAMPVALPERLSPRTLVYDLNYNPRQSLFLREAERRGAHTKNGLDMLIYQAIASLKVWLRQPDLPIDYEQLKRFLEGML
jgi:shikimate dehydrogenase